MALRDTANRMKRALWTLTAAEKWAYQHDLLSADRLTLPQMMGIGLARSGTTWLFRNLSAHPEVQRRSTKELHYFNNHFGRTLRWYASHFADGEGLRFEITPGYAYLSSRQIRFIRSLIPDLRIVLMLRDPISRTWSETIRLRVGKQGRLEDADPDELVATLRRVANATDYVAILDRWESVFPSDQIFVGFFDDIVRCPRRLLTDIFTFAGLSEPTDWESFPYDRRANQVPSIPMGEEHRRLLEAIYGPRIDGMRSRFGARVDGWLTEH